MDIQSIVRFVGSEYAMRTNTVREGKVIGGSLSILGYMFVFSLELFLTKSELRDHHISVQQMPVALPHPGFRLRNMSLVVALL